ncbi:MAG: DUF4041 domain-containing protein [Leptospiraceae bacterium]|nr:DUF4041 domain-containing protein [Leptospiraceae bacterium]
MSVTDMFRVNELKAEIKRLSQELEITKREQDGLIKENSSLKAVLSDVEKMEYLELKKLTSELNSEKEKAKNDLEKFKEWFTKSKEAANQEVSILEKQIESLKQQVVILSDEILIQSFGFYEQRYNLQNSEQYKLRLEDVRSKQKWLIKTEKAVVFPGNVSLMGSLADGEKFIQDFVKLILRSFNSECDTNIANVKFNNVKSLEKKIFNDYDALNKLGKRMNISIAKEYLNLKLDELYLCYEYQAKKEDEKEEQRLIREQMREEAKVQKEIEEIKAKIEKEEKHFAKALKNINNQLDKTKSEDERILLEKERGSILEKMEFLEKDKLDVYKREQNTRAGYVYVISNIGSFGENIFKIGVTRRFDPTERVDELGDASVPFRFDIHAMIFSDDAPALENALHKAFENRRLNMINRRREFFRVSLEEIEEIVKSNFNKPVEIMKIAEAPEYRESLALKNNAPVQ